jgi:glucose/arabinose dehydrogenase
VTCLVGAIASLLCAGSHAQPIAAEITADGLDDPLYVTHAPNDFDRNFILERVTPGELGAIRVFDVDAGVLLDQPFLEIPVNPNGEAGILGLAFHPEYDDNGYIYVNYTSFGGGAWGHTRIERYTRSVDDPNRADPHSARLVIRYDQPAFNHNAGWLDFGPDGFLYVSAGDGGAAFNGQNTDTVLGSMLRLDVDGDDFPADDERNYAIPPDNPFADGGGAPEIWSYALRNPWRNSFDRATGDLYIGDVGSSKWEEVNFQPALSIGGENYGWACAEGADDDCKADTILPIHAFDHTMGSGITGGYVYRGCAIPELVGRYFFAALGSGRVWSLRVVDAKATDLQEHTDQIQVDGGQLRSLVSFGEDAYGELYLTNFGPGRVLKIVRSGPPLNDCNDNGVEDACEILDGSLADTDADGVPDVCECPADVNHDAKLNVLDFIAFQLLWQAEDPTADCNADTSFDITDFICYQLLFHAGC